MGPLHFVQNTRKEKKRFERYIIFYLRLICGGFNAPKKQQKTREKENLSKKKLKDYVLQGRRA